MTDSTVGDQQSLTEKAGDQKHSSEADDLEKSGE